MDETTDFLIRPCRRADRAGVRAVCAATAWLGRPAGEGLGDAWVWAEYWTRYFTDRERRHTRVVARAGGGVAGYLTGTPDVARFDRLAPFLLPGIAWRVVRRRLLRRPAPRRALLNLARSLLRGEAALPAGVGRRFPATFHFNLLPEARGRGLGRRMLAMFLADMRSLGVAGVHAQPLSVNSPAGRALAAAGFRRIARRPITAFAHLDDRPMTVDTWVLDLRGRGGIIRAATS